MRKVILTDELLRRVYGDRRFQAALQAGPAADWRGRGVCVGVDDPDVFFPATPEFTDPARRLCHSCPVIGECLAEALSRTEVDGVWGGTTSAERRSMRAVWRQHAGRGPASRTVRLEAAAG